MSIPTRIARTASRTLLSHRPRRMGRPHRTAQPQPVPSLLRKVTRFGLTVPTILATTRLTHVHYRTTADGPDQLIDGTTA